jgi:hypothetical protein
MPTISSILKKVFSEGIESVSKEDLVKLFASRPKDIERAGAQKIYRRDILAKELMESGFKEGMPSPLLAEVSEARLSKALGDKEAARAVRRGLTLEEEKIAGVSDLNLGGRKESLYDEPGLYWSNAPSSKGVPPYHRKGEWIEGIMNPEAVVKSEVNPEGADFLLRSDFNREHYIQKKAGNVLAKLGDNYKIIGLAAALGLGSELVSPGEAEAGSASTFIKEALALSKEASKKYKGKVLPKEVRDEILNKLAFTPERKAILEKARPAIEEIISRPGSGKTYLHGSFVTEKEVPRDIDLVIGNLPHSEKYKWPSDMLSPKEVGVHSQLSNYNTQPLKSMKYLRKEGKSKYGEDYDWIRIAGVAVALGLGSELASPDEAEASSLFGKILKQGAKTVAKRAAQADSTSSAVLEGKTIMGRVVKEVKKGQQDWRYLVFEDGTEMPVKKELVHNLCREFGTVGKMGELAEKDEASQLMQAIKSLEFHTSRQKTFTTKSMRDDYRKQYVQQMKDLGIEPEEMIHIDKPIQAYIPKKYADILEQAGVIQIRPRKGTK